MIKIKKRISFLTVLLVTLMLLSACGDSGGSQNSDSSDSAATSSDTTQKENTPDSAPAENNSDSTPLVIDGKPIKVAYLASEVSTPWMVANTGFLQNLIERCGGEFVVYNADNNAETQAQQAQDIITIEPDIILLKPVDSAAIVPSVINLNNENIPVICIDTDADDGCDILTLITSDQTKIGGVDATYLSQEYEETYVASMMGPLESLIAQQRQDGFEEAAEAAGNVHVLENAKFDCTWDSNNAYNNTLDALQRNPEINAIWVMGDGMLSGVVAALKEADRYFPYGEEGHVAVVGVDATSDCLSMVRDGSIDGSSEHNAAIHSDVAVRVIIDHLHGYDVPSEILFTPAFVGHKNVDDPNNWGGMDLNAISSWEPLEHDQYKIQYKNTIMK